MEWNVLCIWEDMNFEGPRIEFYRLNVCVPSPRIHMLKSNPQCDGIRSEAFEKWWGHEGGVLMKGISALIKKPHRTPSTFLPDEVTCRTSVCFTRHQTVGALILDFLAYRTAMLLFKPLNLWYFCYKKDSVLGCFVLSPFYSVSCFQIYAETC